MINDLGSIDDFLVLAKTRSFTKASTRRHISQPAFTRRIQQLEEQVGAVLFDRCRTPLVLTAAGERFYSYAQNLSQTYQRALEETRATTTQLRDPIRIATTHTLAISIFPTLWKACLRRRPDLKVALKGRRTEECWQDLYEGAVDFSLVHTIKGHSSEKRERGVECLKIKNDELMPVMAPHARENARKLLTYALDVGASPLRLAQLSPSKQKKIETVFESPSCEVLKAMAVAGHGVAFLPKMLIEDELRDGTLIPSIEKMPSIQLEILLLRLAKKQTEDAETIWKTALERSKN